MTLARMEFSMQKSGGRRVGPQFPMPAMPRWQQGGRVLTGERIATARKARHPVDLQSAYSTKTNIGYLHPPRAPSVAASLTAS